MCTDPADPPRSYIDTLPPELLRRIFLYAKALDPSDSLMEPPLSVHRSHVSQRWRNVALSCQELWSRWPRNVSDGYWTKLCYERSLQTALDLWISIDTETLHPSALEAGRALALGQISRARTIEFEVSLYDDDERILDSCSEALGVMCDSDAHQLESLSLSITHPYRLRHSIFPTKALFRGRELPQLHTIILQNFHMRHSDKILAQNLRSLTMKQSSAWDTIDEMIEFLRTVPHLEELSYLYEDGCRGRPPIEYTRSKRYPIRCVSLPQLKKFELSVDRHEGTLAASDFLPGIFIFSYCAMPCDTVLRLLADELNENDNEVDQDRSAVGPKIIDACTLGSQALNEHFTQASQHGQGYDVVTVKNRTIRPNVERQVSDSSMLPREMKLVLPHVDVQGRRGWVSQEACSMYLDIPVFRTTTELRVKRTAWGRNLFHYFPAFPAVRVLTLCQKAVEDFVQPPRFSTFAERFHSLETIRLLEFDCSRYVYGSGPPARRLMTFEEALLHTLRECEEAGLCSMWKYIEFVGCSNGEDVVEGIRKDVRLQGFNERVQVVVSTGEGHVGMDVDSDDEEYIL